jgi:phosphosulfolactate synthase
MYNLPYIPKRTKKPRKYGVAMVMDKGLSINEAENIISTAGQYIDFVKLGFGTSAVMNNIKEKVLLYKKANIKTYLGGTLFEAYIIRNMFTDYIKLIDSYKIDTLEVSDGSIAIDHDKKCEYINKLSKSYTVLSEVGSKKANVIIQPDKWIEMMENELSAGSSFVIAEARESGTVGIYHPNGKANTELINEILKKVEQEKILWEAPQKSQQAWFIKNFGHNVNLGNIAPREVISLETLRVGLRGDTFSQFLPEKLQKKYMP